MDERLEQALAVSKALETHQNQKNILHKQYKDNLIYYFDGQKISVDLSLIAYCTTKTMPIVIIDDNKILSQIEENKKKPVKVGGFRARLQKALEEAEKQKKSRGK